MMQGQRRLPHKLFRWMTSGVHEVPKEAPVKPFSAVPSPSGALPIIGHQRLLKGFTSMSKFTVETFKDLGPIFRLDFIGIANVM